MATLPATDEGIPAPLRPPRVCRLETDTFCQHCNYNLFGQEVKRDARLGILVCRCPECGSFHPAGRGVAAASKQLSPSVTLGMWVLFCVFVVCLGSFILVAMQSSYLYQFSTIINQTADGRPVEMDYASGKYQFVIAGTHEVVTRYISRHVPDEWNRVSTNQYDPSPYSQRLLPYLIGSAIVGLVLGVMFAVCCWHWKRRAYFALLLPFLVGLITFAFWRNSRASKDLLPWSISRIAIHSGYVTIVLLLAIWLGRPMARLALRLVLPPRPRQHFAYLWAADGKSWPPVQLENLRERT